MELALAYPTVSRVRVFAWTYFFVQLMLQVHDKQQPSGDKAMPELVLMTQQPYYEFHSTMSP